MPSSMLRAASSLSWPIPVSSTSSKSNPVALPSSCTAGGARAKMNPSCVLGENAHPAAGDRRHLVGDALAELPRLQRDERDAAVLRRSCEAEAVDGVHALDVLGFRIEEMVADQVEALLRPRGRRSRRSLHQRDRDALVLVGQETGRQADEEQRHADDDQQVDERGALPPADGRRARRAHTSPARCRTCG